MNIAHPTHPPPIKTVFLNPSPTWTGHSHHYDYLTTLNNIIKYTCMVYYPPPPPPTRHIYLLVVPIYDYFRTIFKKLNQNESWTNPLTHFQSYL